MKKEVKGIFWKGALWYYDKTEDFINAFPGFKLWIEVDQEQKCDQKIQKKTNCN